MINEFNPRREDANILNISDAIHFANKMIEFGAFLRNIDQSKLNIELDRFFNDGYIGPITLAARSISPSLRQVWHYNSPELYEVLEKNSNSSAIFLMLFLNEFYFPIDNNMPTYYKVLDIQFSNKNYQIGIVDRRNFAKKIEVESILIDGKIIKSEKHVDNFDNEFSVYEIEYAYTWNSRIYSNADVIKLNTSHLGWANIGGLLNFPKIDLTVKDLDEMLSPGKEIKVFIAKDNCLIRNPVYDDFVYEVGKM